jgi:hypothetical protein
MGEDKFDLSKLTWALGSTPIQIEFGIVDFSTNIKEDNEMGFVSKNDYEKAIGQVKKYEERQIKIKQFKTELGKRLKEFDKTSFKTKDNRIIFAGYYGDKYDNGHIKIGEAICDESDVYNKLLGKLIAVRKALGMKIDDIVEVVEPKKNNWMDAYKGNGQTYTFTCDLK